MVVTANGPNDIHAQHKSNVFGVKQLSSKEGKYQAHKIEEIMNDFTRISNAFECTQSPNNDQLLQNFVAFQSDHVALNGHIHQTLEKSTKEQGGEKLVWLKCSMHKLNLVEEYFIIILKSTRPSNDISQPPPPKDIIQWKGMKASTGYNTASSTDFLYQCSKMLSTTTKGEKTN